MYKMISLQTGGFTPDTIAVHCGWGESLPVRAIFPDARMVVYSEFYYAILKALLRQHRFRCESIQEETSTVRFNISQLEDQWQQIQSETALAS
jgi:hypothetical protein